MPQTSMTRHWMKKGLLVACIATLAACEGGDLINPHERPTPGKAVPNPFSISNSSDEVFSRNIGAMPLLTIDFPNKKGEEPVVRSVVNDIQELTAPASQPKPPATKPAIAEPEPNDNARPGKEDIKLAAQQKPADNIVFIRDNEANIDLWITSESGIGNVLLERLGEGWPPIIRLHLNYAKEKPFTRLEGLTAFEVVGDRQVTLKTSFDKETAKAQVNIPSFSRAPQILIQWVDAYR